jgi:hypothetical protein
MYGAGCVLVKGREGKIREGKERVGVIERCISVGAASKTIRWVTLSTFAQD